MLMALGMGCQVIHAVTIAKKELQWNAMTPQGISALGRACMEAECHKRPTFQHIEHVLQAMQGLTSPLTGCGAAICGKLVKAVVQEIASDSGDQEGEK